MKIELEDFKIEESEGIVRFDLFKKRTFGSGSNKGKSVWEAEAYGVSFERAVGIIISKRIDTELEDATFQQFIDEYKAISERTLDQVKLILAEARGTSAK